MESYTLDFKNHIFKIGIGEVNPRWEQEGIIQTIRLSVNNCIVYRETFGIERALNNFKSETYEFTEDGAHCLFLDYKSKKISFAQLFDMDITLTDKDFDYIISWIITSLTPITVQRKEKVERIRKTNKCDVL
jgi:hypothetical protein